MQFSKTEESMGKEGYITYTNKKNKLVIDAYQKHGIGTVCYHTECRDPGTYMIVPV